MNKNTKKLIKDNGYSDEDIDKALTLYKLITKEDQDEDAEVPPADEEVEEPGEEEDASTPAPEENTSEKDEHEISEDRVAELIAERLNEDNIMGIVAKALKGKPKNKPKPNTDGSKKGYTVNFQKWGAIL